jgi:hypothetical protein
MNQLRFGDSYDIVKRFFCEVLRGQRYDIFIEPMFTDERQSSKESLFYRFLDVKHVSDHTRGRTSTALLVDPDTGVSNHDRKKHVSFDRIADLCKVHRIVFVFDQAFSRSRSRDEQMKEKLTALVRRKRTALYYKSHACFLFASRSRKSICRLRDHLVRLGVPEKRLVMRSPTQ